MRARLGRWGFSVLSAGVLLGGSACQSGALPTASAPTAPEPTSVVSVSDATPVPQSASVPLGGPAAGAAAPAPRAPRPSPTPLATLPRSALDNVAPDQALAVHAARAALAAGDPARAQALLDPLVPILQGEQQAEVELLYGQALLGMRQFDAALASTDALLGQTTRPDLVSAARFLKGQALRGLQRWAAAATEMRAVADANPLVAAGVRLELEDMWLQEANQPDQAAVDGQQGLDLAQPRLLKIQLAENLGTARVALNQTDAAMDAYRQLLTEAGTQGYLGEQLYNLAVGASALGRTDDAITALRTALAQFPHACTAPEAVVLLEKLGGMRPEDRFYAGVIRYLFWNFPGARADFNAYLAALPEGDRAMDARYYRALSSPDRDTVTQMLALADAAPDDDFAPMALLEAGKAEENLGDYAGAEAIYARLVASYPTRDAGLDGAFRQGLARYMQQAFDGALSAWTALLARDPSPGVRAQTLYWSGKALAASGDAAAARDRLQSAAAVRPVDYYVMRAQVALDPPPPASDLDGADVGPTDTAELAHWFSTHGLDLTAAAEVAGQDPAYLRATALVQHGLYREANWEFEGFLSAGSYADKPDRLYWLAARFGDMGLPNAQLKLGTAALAAATAEGQVSILDVPRALARVASPLAFPGLVGSLAAARGLDPLLFTALMRQESDFDPHAESVAKAKGLTQIVPQTASEIARALQVPDFQQSDLFQPRENVQFGAYYFAQRLKRNGNVERALAAYNAGDGNVDTWTTPGRDDPDVFTEYVAFEETHKYVESILLYYWTSRYVWAR